MSSSLKELQQNKTEEKKIRCEKFLFLGKNFAENEKSVSPYMCDASQKSKEFDFFFINTYMRCNFQGSLSDYKILMAFYIKHSVKHGAEF